MLALRAVEPDRVFIINPNCEGAHFVLDGHKATEETNFRSRLALLNRYAWLVKGGANDRVVFGMELELYHGTDLHFHGVWFYYQTTIVVAYLDNRDTDVAACWRRSCTCLCTRGLLCQSSSSKEEG